MKLRRLSQLAWDSFWLCKNDNGIPPSRVWLVPPRQALCNMQVAGR